MRQPYPSDVSNAQWAIIEPLIPVNTVGRPRTNDMQEILNAIFSLNRSGCQWDMLPHDLPAKSTVYDHFRTAGLEMTEPGSESSDALRQKIPTAEGRDLNPSRRKHR